MCGSREGKVAYPLSRLHAEGIARTITTNFYLIYDSDMNPQSLERLKQILDAPEDEIDVAEAALLLAQEEYPKLDVSAYLRRLDEMAQAVRETLPANAAAAEIIFSLNRYLFHEQGFDGDAANYYDPRNCFINQVLERKVGIPITLSIIYMEIGQRLGLPLQGISFPGHFLVKLSVESGEIVLDPFSGGVSLGRDELEQQLAQTQGDKESAKIPLEEWLVTATKKDMLVRVLHNLKGIYAHGGQLEKTLSVINRILLVAPELAEEVRDRGLVYRQLECFRAALTDLQTYLQMEPESEDRDEIRDNVIDLQKIVARLN